MANRDALQRRLREPYRLGMWLDFRPRPGTPATAELYGEYLELGTRADELGYSLILASEHHGSDDDYLPTPLLSLAAIAARTTRALLGPGVGLAPLWPPRILAEELTVLDLISGGRAIAGLAVGYTDFDFQALGVDRSGRGRDLDVRLDELERAWKAESVLSDGRPLAPRAEQADGPAIMLGGDADAALRRVAQRADVFFGDANYNYRDIVPKWERLVAIASDGEPPLLVLGTHLWVCDDDELWEQELAPSIAYQLSRYYQWRFDEDERPTEIIEPGSLERRKFLVGPPDQLIRQLEELFTLVPIDCLCAWGRPPGVSHEAAMLNAERLAKEVMPSVASDLA
jgi:alkanesulfonate monooxygenase SsuD/methylene tetrahydromethanopterin reductase-like flavin-dependent oxidoreductase (luciferase family)